jgi:hypothetical protein
MRKALSNYWVQIALVILAAALIAVVVGWVVVRPALTPACSPSSRPHVLSSQNGHLAC